MSPAESMLPTPSNNHGMGLVEVVIALFITTIAVFALLSLQPVAWQTAQRSDYLGRAANLLYDELQSYEVTIMNPCQPIPAASATRYVYASHTTNSPLGDARFTVTTTVTALSSDTWRVTSRVQWPNHPGIVESLVVTRQETYRYPPGCASQ